MRHVYQVFVLYSDGSRASEPSFESENRQDAYQWAMDHSADDHCEYTVLPVVVEN